jgi:hypothetical protein
MGWIWWAKGLKGGGKGTETPLPPLSTIKWLKTMNVTNVFIPSILLCCSKCLLGLHKVTGHKERH